MPSKTQEYLALANRTANSLSRRWEHWAEFLITASRMYKYSFPEQLMIYAQRPDATACADYDVWNGRMNRYIRRGSKGIALLDESRGYPRLRYVFDVSDTGVRKNSRTLDLWWLDDDLKQPVAEMLASQYGVQHENFGQQLANVAGKLTDFYWDNNCEDIFGILDGSYLMSYDEATREYQFKSAMSMGITYMMLERCGLEPVDWFDEKDFQAIYDFTTPSSVYALGTAVSDCSREVLRSIERTVKATIRRRNAERSQHEQQSELHEDRGLPASEPDPEPAENSSGQVRQDAPDLSEGAASGAVQHHAPDRRTVPDPAGAGADRRADESTDDRRTAEAESGPGQREEPAGMGAAHEQSGRAGGRSDSSGADLQLSFLGARIPTEEEQIKSIDQAEREKSPSAFVLSQAEIEHELREHGSGFQNGKYRITALYQNQPDRKLRAKALAKEYGAGGHTHYYLDGSTGYVSHDSRGLEFEHYPDHQKTLLRWNQIEKYIDLMIQSDRYLTEEEKEKFAAVQKQQLPMLDDTAAAEYKALKEQYPNTLVGFELGGYFLFYGEDANTVSQILKNRILPQENAMGKVQVSGFLREQWGSEFKKLWAKGNNVYLAGLNEDGTHYQHKHLLAEDYLPLGSIIRLDGRKFRVDKVDFEKEVAVLQDVAMAELRMPIFREQYLPGVRELYEEDSSIENMMLQSGLPQYEVGDHVVVPLPTRTIEGTIGYVGETDVRVDPDNGYSWEHEVLNKEQFEDALRKDERNAELFVEAVPEAAGNYRITDDHLGEGGAKQKYSRNVAAIRTLLQLEQENRGATAEEQEVLAQYVGWGGLADVFDKDKSGWAKEHTELKELLSGKEYEAARASTLNAHYTSPTVIRAIYNAVEKMGFRSGNILEPSMGTGNFFGMLPDTMQDSRLYGVELDSITGRIAQKLYPKANITVAGFQTTDRRDFFDLAIGNVPFGDYGVNDRVYNKLNFSIHNYFFAKAISQVRPGGIIAFVTSRYTLDSKESKARKYIAERADLLGAIRLPNDAFKKNAGTNVVSDILFLQKRDRPIDREPDWVQLGKTEDGFAINQYFVDHPEMVLGKLTTESTQYGHSLTVAPVEGAVLADQLAEAIQHIEGEYAEAVVETPDIADAEMQRKTLPADPDVKNFSYTVVDGEVYYRENSIMTQIELSDTAKERVNGMVELRQIVHELIQQQLDDFPDEEIKATQERLNATYDAFSAKYGLLNDRKNGRLFEDDSSYYLLCSLENLDENKQLKSKAAMFTKRTIRPERTITSVDTPSEALVVSIGEKGRVDLPYMAELLGTPGEYGRITTELSGVIFKDPAANADDPVAGWQMADEYLSGNVRAKLRMAQLAAEAKPEFAVNVTALEKAQPKDLEASEIDVRLGATWLDSSIIQKFMLDTFKTPTKVRLNDWITVRYSSLTAEWRIDGKGRTGSGDITANETYGTHRINAYKILEDTLNLKDVRVYDYLVIDGQEQRVLNQKETMLAQQKQQAIKDAFGEWIWKDPQRRTTLVKQYNELFNSTRPREYDGSHIHFVGMNPEITLREHQRNAIAHVLYGGNVLLAHEVGAGKTFEMAASAMEAKRLGLCQKSLFVVPNHLTEQWASEFLLLYPNAKLLVTSKKDFSPANRKKFCARISTGDYDAVIIGHSQFEKIPLSAERQERIIQDQIDSIQAALKEMSYSNGDGFSIKQIEKTRKNLELKLEKLRAAERKDDVVTFEQLGVDRLFVDESHAFKNLFLYTKMRNVAGLSTTEAQKSSDMFGKCRYLDEITGGRGVIFATGTPISNSMTEMYTLMRYLQYNTLQQKGLTHFDAWASTFGETSTAIELAPEGTGYRARTRFAQFFNLPELMNMFKEVADIKTSDQLNLPVPESKFETVVVKPSAIQKEMVQALSERAARVHDRVVEPSEDNMLKITSDGRKIGLDQRLMNPDLPDDPNSKLNTCVRNVLRIWEEGKEQKLTQLLFCDLSTPKNDGTFNVYDDIKSKLLAAGVPENEVEFIHNADTEAKKDALFSKVRAGDVRILLGSTAKMGAGTNVQKKLVAVHHLDVGWRPSDMTQRNGRIIRQGNQNKEVQVYNYVTEGTFDAYLWQTLENKQRFISQIMTSKSPVRSCEDVDEQALSYAEVKALCAGDPRIREKMDLDVQVAKLRVLKANHQSQKYRLEDMLLKHYPVQIQKQQEELAGLRVDAQTVHDHPQGNESFCGMTINGMFYDERKTAGERLFIARDEMTGTDFVPLGSYRGFELSLGFDSFESQFKVRLKGNLHYDVPLGNDAVGTIVRVDNVLSDISWRIPEIESRLENLRQQQEAAKIESEKPFPQDDELRQKSARLAELDAALNLEKHREPKQQEQPVEDAPRPSVLAALHEKAEQAEPVKPFKSYLDKDGDAR